MVGTATAARRRTTTEDDLWASYGNDPAVTALRRTVRRPCVCRGVVEADPDEPTLGVAIHNSSDRHQAWRKATA